MLRSFFRDDEVHGHVVSLWVYRWQARELKADTDDQRAYLTVRDRPVVEASAIPEAKPSRIKAHQGGNQYVRTDCLAFGGDGDVPDAPGH